MDVGEVFEYFGKGGEGGSSEKIRRAGGRAVLELGREGEWDVVVGTMGMLGRDTGSEGKLMRVACEQGRRDVTKKIKEVVEGRRGLSEVRPWLERRTAGAKRQQKHCTAFLHNEQPSALRFAPHHRSLLTAARLRKCTTFGLAPRGEGSGGTSLGKSRRSFGLPAGRVFSSIATSSRP